MRYLTVLYDRDCALCRRARLWLQGQRKYLPLRFVAAQSDEARQMFPSLADSLLERFTVVSDEGGVYRDEAGWIMCLYALKRYRRWARRMAAPGRRFLVGLMIKRIGRNRPQLSSWLMTMLNAPPVLDGDAATTPLFCDVDGRCAERRENRPRTFAEKHASRETRPTADAAHAPAKTDATSDWFD